MKHEWVAILITALVLLLGLATLLRIVLRLSKQKPFTLPALPTERVLFPIGPLFPGNNEAAATELHELLAPESQLLLTLVYEVPRAVALEKAEPEAQSLRLLDRVQQTLVSAGVVSEPSLTPCRNSLEEVLRLIGSQKATALFVRIDPSAETDSLRALLERAPCSVLLSRPPK